MDRVASKVHHQHHYHHQHPHPQRTHPHHHHQQLQQHQQHQQQHQQHQQHQLQLQIQIQQHQKHYHDSTLASSSSSSSSSSSNSPLGCQLAAQNKRKEKARIAARARRSQEASIIMEMANELHITQEKIRRIDKATIVKLAIDYIKAFKILCRFCSNNCRQQGDNKKSILYYYTPPSDLAHPAPKLSTGSIFAPKTEDIDSHFLMINERDGKSSFELKPDDEILDEDDLTHLAPQAGDMTIPLEAEPLDGIVLDTMESSFPFSSGDLSKFNSSVAVSN